MTNIIHLAFQGKEMDFREDGWFNATAAAEHFGKRVQDYLDNRETGAYMGALATALNHANQRDLIRSSRGRGGGTWFHPKVAVHFARWLNIEFAVWCDIQIDNLIRGAGDHKRARHAAASSHKVMCQVLQMTRFAEGKSTMPHHFINEAKLVNWSIGGAFAGLNRESLTTAELDALAAREIQNAVMIGTRISYEERKAELGKGRSLPDPDRKLPVRNGKRLPRAA